MTNTNVGPVDPAPDRSETPPTLTDGVPDSCLVCTVGGDWAHFRRIDRTVTKQTYRLPPRTTVAGLLAAIVGVGRDEYYDVFDPAVSAVGVEVVGDLRTTTQPSLGVGTNPGETFDSAGGSGKKTVKVRFPDTTDNRQIHSYEYVVDPAYRLYVAVEDEAFHAALKHHLERGTSYYPPSLGLSELLARVETPEAGVEHDVTAVAVDDTVAVDSAIPEAVETIVPRAGTPHHVERLPAAMEADGRNRRTTEFTDYAFTADGQLETTGDGLALGDVAGRTVAFY
ncbi:type I-B CRISPR-associated protein Cas5b [Halorussus caseinilyticus]|uniref:Type I-B CRISPR-associated protein Cas5b n=1 Tax=Halorussus caseinilyticus TaxID=3034025 RepID=A0ABD5WEZ3_9EURY|nr:type I-B CRISPR-associated protein Cas5b [Halorussus sp. DT72]